MSMLFKSKTIEAYQIKVLAELLSNNLKTGCFEVDNNGISLRMIDQNKKILIDLILLSENHSKYKFKPKNKILIGLTLTHFHKMLKSIKKKDSLQLFIKSDIPNELGIRTIPKENTRITTSYVTIQNIQSLDIKLPSGYGKPINVLSSEFQKMCKDLSSIGSNVIRVKTREFNIQFSCDADNVLKRNVTLGESKDSDSESDDSDDILYDQTFNTDQFTKITKISGMSNIIQIYASPNLPLLFKSNIGTIGKLSLYIKSRELIQEENETNEYSE
jgi:proliferating cell nuclear antigen PCNA